MLCFNDKLQVGDLVHLSIRPEKFRIAREEPPPAGPPNRCGHGGGHDLPRARTRSTGCACRTTASPSTAAQPLPARREADPWKDEVWIWWHADDGFMLERYRAADENAGPDAARQLVGGPPAGGGQPGACGSERARAPPAEWLLTLPVARGWRCSS
jgi:hypothetical protein